MVQPQWRCARQLAHPCDARYKEIGRTWQHMPFASSKVEQQVPHRSTHLALPPHTPQASTTPEAQQAPTPSSTAPAGQHMPPVSTKPEGQHCCCASITPVVQLSGSCKRGGGEGRGRW
mgnify:CR=1 FL=1